MDDDDTPNYREVRLRDLRPMDVPIMIVGRVVRAELREVARRSGGANRRVLSGLLTDGTATVRFTWWEPPEEGIDPGTILRAANVVVREYRGRPEVSFTSRTRVVPADVGELPSSTGTEIPLLRAADLRPGSDGFRMEVRVLAIRPKEVTVRGERRAIFEGVVGDDSGPLAFTAWNDLHLVEGDTVRVVGASGREFGGRPQLTLDDRCGIKRIPFDQVRTRGPSDTPPTIDALEASGGSPVASIEGTVVAVLPPSGLVERCPDCRRTMTAGTCRTHGTRAGVPDLRARLVVDDGTGAVTVELGRSAVEGMLGLALEQAVREAASGAPGLDSRLTEEWFGRRVRASGRCLRNEFGLTLFADDPVRPAPALAVSGGPLRQTLEGLRP